MTADSNHDYRIAKNLFDRNFTTMGPNEKWATDITYIWTSDGWLHLVVVMDLYSRRIVGWSLADHMQTELCLEALQMAVEQRTNTKGLTHRPDRGVQYASDRYRGALDSHKIACSISLHADCWDNAVAESFFRTLKNELVYRRPWLTRMAARDSISEYIEIFYNQIRRHLTIGNVSPARFEEMAMAKEAEAA